MLSGEKMIDFLYNQGTLEGQVSHEEIWLFYKLHLWLFLIQWNC